MNSDKLSVSSVGSSPLQRRSDRPCPWRARSLSVSSVGSSPLQPPTRIRRPFKNSTFSILGRIEPTATWLRTSSSGALRFFQYPRSDRAHCNPCFRPRADRLVHFQYPRSDRAHCNHHSALLWSWKELIFQYPRSDRAHCNAGPHPAGRLGRLGLSVSSVGSSPLQLHHLIRTIRLQELSVSSVGSSPLQPHLDC